MRRTLGQVERPDSSKNVQQAIRLAATILEASGCRGVQKKSRREVNMSIIQTIAGIAGSSTIIVFFIWAVKRMMKD